MKVLALLPLLPLLAACSAGYFLQAAAGQVAVLKARQPLEQVLADPDLDPDRRRQLLVADSALVFARTHLGLPRTGSYRHFADLGRPYVVWNVVAATEFSLEPREWCFPVAGCLAYKGWFQEGRARAEAAGLADQGYDVYVGGVAAYATLGWFDDPLLNTMLDQPDEWLAGLIFHELAHLLVYVPGDSTFNESFASFVEQEGQRRWLAFRRDEAGLAGLKVREQRRGQVLALLQALRRELATLYGSGAEPGVKRQAKAAALDRARAAYAGLRAGWAGPPWYDGWFGPGLNNASLAALSTYGELVPAFAELLARCDGELPAFYERVKSLAALDDAARADALAALLPAAAPGLSDRPAGDGAPWHQAVRPSPGPAGRAATASGG